MLNTIVNRIARFLWWSGLRRPFRALVRRSFRNVEKIQTGPLRGKYFNGGLAHMLGIYETEVQSIIKSHLFPGAVFYDIGANNGFITLLAASLVGHDGLVFAFEPLPGNVRILQKNIEMNYIQGCVLVDKAVSNKNGRQELFVSKSSATPSLLRAGPHDVESISVSTVTLDEFVQSHPAPDLIKMDVEGAEVDVLEGATSLLYGDKAPGLIIEVHDQKKGEEVEKILGNAGYRIERLPVVDKKRRDFPAHWYGSPKD